MSPKNSTNDNLKEDTDSDSSTLLGNYSTTQYDVH